MKRLILVGAVASGFLWLVTNAANNAINAQDALIGEVYRMGCVYGAAMEGHYKDEPTNRELTNCKKASNVLKDIL